MSRANPYPIGYLIGPVVAGPFLGVPILSVPVWSTPAQIVIQPPLILTVAGPPAGMLDVLLGNRLGLLPGGNANLGLGPGVPALQPPPANANPPNQARPAQRAPQKKAAAPAPRKPAEPPLPGPAAPLADPKKESNRLIESGREAFALREYARAEHRFGEAVQLLPDRPLTYFLLAEAQFAQGKYREAYDSIHSGLQFEPAWPAAYFRPRRLYGLNQADPVRQLDELKQALDHYPEDPVLVFLYAYHLWFDGRPAEARPLFQRGEALAPGSSEAFLQAVPYVALYAW
jgi:tetratricopeptide (TPR) repeat protein